MSSSRDSMHVKQGLFKFSDLYANHQGEPKFWSEALEKTKDFVKKALQQSTNPAYANGVKLERGDLGTLSSFLRNQNCLEDFLGSEYFLKNEHTPLLINLIRLGYKAAAGFDVNIIETEGYEYVFSGDDIDIFKLCAMGSNEEAGNAILQSGIFAED